MIQYRKYCLLKLRICDITKFPQLAAPNKPDAPRLIFNLIDAHMHNHIDIIRIIKLSLIASVYIAFINCISFVTQKK